MYGEPTDDVESVAINLQRTTRRELGQGQTLEGLRTRLVVAQKRSYLYGRTVYGQSGKMRTTSSRHHKTIRGMELLQKCMVVHRLSNAADKSKSDNMARFSESRAKKMSEMQVRKDLQHSRLG